jgi:splicing factor 3A subunit 1
MVITGVIRPPPEIRAVADRTALYVTKNGRAFEARILKSEKGKTPKFAFLQPTSPFHAYYEDKIQFYENGGTDQDENNDKQQAAQDDTTNTTTTTTNGEKEESKKAPASRQGNKKSKSTSVRKVEKKIKASAIDPIAKALLAERNKIQQARSEQEKAKAAKLAEEKEPSSDQPTAAAAAAAAAAVKMVPLVPPPPLELVNIVAPSFLSLMQIETIQLVAQFTAMDGKGGQTFLPHLSLREWSNSAFAFCQPRHAHFAYFSALVDAYRTILQVWTSAPQKPLPKAPDETNAAEDVDVDAVDVKVLDLQECLQQAAYRAEYELDMLQQVSQQEEGEIVAIDWHDFVVVETIDFQVDEVVELSMLPPPPPPPQPAQTKQNQNEPATALTTANGANNTGGMEESSDDEDDDDQEETIRVVPSYTPKVVGTFDSQMARAIDPITGKSVPVADMTEHMRIQLLDPKWAEERKKFQDKQTNSNLVSGDAIASNISRFAQARGDLFGKSVRTTEYAANRIIHLGIWDFESHQSVLIFANFI